MFDMTRFELAPLTYHERLSRMLLAHVEAAAERDGIEPPVEAQAMATLLKEMEKGRTNGKAE